MNARAKNTLILVSIAIPVLLTACSGDSGGGGSADPGDSGSDTAADPGDSGSDTAADPGDSGSDTAADPGDSGSDTAEPVKVTPHISAGADRTCALNSSGVVKCWGELISRPDALVPTVMDGFNGKIVKLAVGGDNDCALSEVGSAQCWGFITDCVENVENGSLSGHEESRPTPPVGLESGVVDVSAGQFHYCAVTKDGAAICGGDNRYGVIGTGELGWGGYDCLPTQVVGLASGVVAISAGPKHSCVRKESGGVVCWGGNAAGQLGDGTKVAKYAPTQVVGLESGVVALSVGAMTCVLTDAEKVLCWGPGVGGTKELIATVPTLVEGVGSDVRSIAAGIDFGCALTNAGAVKCWGSNEYGQLGNGTDTGSVAAGSVYGLESGVIAITAGYYHACAIKEDESAVCWGRNRSGQLGNGTEIDIWMPVPVQNFP